MTIVVQLTRKLIERPGVPLLEGVRLRHYAGGRDIEIWLDLRRRAFARQRLGVRDWDEDDFRREFLEKDWWRPEVMWIAEASGPAETALRPVGTITLARRGEPPTSRPVVHWLAVRPGYRGRGIGRLLVSTLEAAAWDAGQRQIWLESHSQWAQAMRLYKSLGYEPAED